MKNLLSVLFITLLSAQSFAASGSLICTNGVGVRNFTAVLADQVRMECSNGYYAAINGIGVGLLATVGGFIISCIGDSSENLDGTYYGAKMDASFMVGLSGSAYVSKKGICVVGGVNIGLGAGATISTLQIYK